MALKERLEKWQLKATIVDQEVPFSFHLYRFKFDGLFFLTLNLILPFCLLLGLRIVWGNFDSYPTAGLIFVVLNLVFALINLVYFAAKDFSLFIKSGLFVFSAFQIFPTLFLLFFGTLGERIWNNEIFKNGVWPLFLQLIAETVILILALVYTWDLKKRLILTLRKNWRSLLLITFGALIFLLCVTYLFNFLLQNTPLVEQSANQKGLTKYLSDPNLTSGLKVSLWLLLALFTIVVAPLVEELATRAAWFIGCGNRLAGWITAPLFFGLLHVQGSADLEHIFPYWLGGLVLSTVFNFCRGNVTYSWTVHLCFNTFNFLLLLTSPQ